MSATIAVRDRPILMSGEMVRATLDDRKTKTRRRLAPQPVVRASGALEWIGGGRTFSWFEGGSMPDLASVCPYGQPGDRLWVRETFFDHGIFIGNVPTRLDERVEYRAEPWDRDCDDREAGRWTPSIHMPRWASRLTLEITEVRVERLGEISEQDAEAEGYSDFNPTPANARERFLNGDWCRSLPQYRDGSYLGLWVWVIAFRRVPS